MDESDARHWWGARPAYLLCSFSPNSSYFNWIKQTKNRYLSQDRWETDWTVSGCWSLPFCVPVKEARLGRGRLVFQPQRRAPQPRCLPEHRPRNRRSGWGSMGRGCWHALVDWRPVLLAGTLAGHLAARRFGKWVGSVELLFYTTCLWQWQLG